MSYKNESERLSKKYSSTTHYILSGLVPYTESNAKLSFKPSRFFADLEKLDKIKAKRKSLRTSYYRAIKKGYVEVNDSGTARLTEKGQAKIKPYIAKKLEKNARILVVFDIPEAEKYKRDRLRLLLKELRFRQIQKSVWETKYDVLSYLSSEIVDNRLQGYVIAYESARIKF